MKIKSLFAIAAMALLTVNCVQEEAGPLETTVKVEAVMENELSTKTNVDQTGYFTWAEGDQIGIHTNAGDLLVGKLNKDSHGQSTGVFSYTVIGDAPVLSGVAVYPYNDGHVIADDKLTFVMPAEYDLGAAYTNTNAAMLAMNPAKRDGSASYSFSHLAGVMRFEFKNAPVGADKFTLSLGGQKINGSFEVDLSAPVITTGEATDEQKTTTLKFKALEEVQNLVLFVPVPTGEYTGIEAKLYAGEEELGKWGAATAKNDIKKRSLVLMAPITFGDVPGGIENNVNVATAKQLTEAVAKGGTITLTEDISLSEILVVSKNTTLDGNGHKITSKAGRAINVSGADDVTIKNLTIVASGERAINVIQNTKKVTIDNVIATSANYTVNVASSAPDAIVAINNSTLNGLCTVNVSAVGAHVTIDNCTVNCNDNNTTAGESYAALCLNKEAIGGSIVATNSTINVTDGSDSVKGRNGAENGTVIIGDSTDDVLVTVAVITYEGSPYYHGFPTVAAAIEFAKENDVITLIRDINVAKPITISKSITLDGNSKTLTYSGSDRAIEMPYAADADYDVTIKNLKVAFSGNYSQRGINYNDNGKLTLENVTVNEAGKNVTYALNLPGSSDNADVIINNSSLTGNIALNVWGENLTITANNSNLTSVDNNTTEGYSAIVLNNDGSTIADGTTVKINGGTITALDENGNQASAVRNSTNTGKVEISAETDVNGVSTRPVAIVTYDNTDNFYSFVSLQAAIDKAIETNAVSVKLIANVAVSELIKIESPVVIDLNGMKVTAECKKAFEVHANATIKNGTIEAQQRCVDTRKAVELNLEDVTLIADNYYSAYGNPQPLTIGGSENGTKVKITNSTISAKIGYGIITFVKTETIVSNSNISGYNALYVKPGSDDSTFEFINSTLTGSTADNDKEGNSFSTVAVRANNVTVTADAESEIKAVGNYCYALSFGGQASGEETTTGNTATIAATITGNILTCACAEANTIKVKAEYAENLKEAGYAVSEPVDGFVQVVTLMERNLAFEKESGTATLGTDFTLPALTGDGDLTQAKYSVTEGAAATVTEAGVVTLVKGGTVIITATVPADGIYLAGEATFTLTVEIAEFNPVAGYVYMKPSAEWLSDGARFAAYFFNQTWKDMTLVKGQVDIYQCEIPDGQVNVIFCRMNPNTTANNWNEGTQWTKTVDLNMWEGNLYTVSDWNDGSWSGDPAVSKPETPEQTPGMNSEWALAGTFNAWGNEIFKTTATEGLFVIENLVLDAGDEIKVKIAADWDTSYGGGIKYLKQNCWMTVYDNGANVPVSAAGTYDVYFDLSNKKLYLMAAGTEYTSAAEQNADGPAPVTPSEWYIVGNFNNWNPGDSKYRMADDGTYYVFDNFTAVSGCEMKFAPGKWSGDKGASGNFSANKWLSTGGSNIKVSVGTYKIYLTKDLKQYKFEKK